jgi:cytochrome c oxidase subunit 3/cytochrome o ubiquinol oxidase subunit 3
LSESSFFSVFLVAYLFYIGKSLAGPYPSDVLELPLLATFCLLSSSGTVVIAVRSLEAGRRGRFIAALSATVFLGGSFIAATAVEWRSLIFEHGLTISTNLFGTTFYSLVGFHAAHVNLWLSFLSLVICLGVLGHDLSEHAARLELLSWYWHFFEVFWIAELTVDYVVGVR